MRKSLSALIWTTLMSVALADPVRVAVISDADHHDLAALVTAELSGMPEVVVVERDDLAKIGDEQKLQQMASSDAPALGKLVHADGLLFLSKEGEALHVRLTAVGLGYSVFDLQIAPGMNANDLAQSLGHRVGQFVPKLKLTTNRAIPISVLNLRSDLSTLISTKIERDLTLLLESRLASIPEYVVLERRHAWDLGFEHSLLMPSDPQLLQGAYVLDGTLRITEANGGEIHAELRLRAPKSNQETPLQVSGRADNLPGLVEAMTTQINKAIGSPTSTSTWQPQTEAREYLREGIWAWEHGQPQAAVEALDSAELLGETAPDLLAARIQALCQLAVPDLNPSEAQFIGDQNVLSVIFGHLNQPRYYTPLLPLPDRLAFAKRALADLTLYAQTSSLPSYHLQFLDPKWQHGVQLGYAQTFVIHAASSVLTELDQNSDPETESFRKQVRQGAGFDPLNKKIPEDRGDGAFFADEWAHSLEEETSYYQQVLSAPGAEGQFNAVFLKSRFIWEQGTKFCPRFIKDPVEQQRALIEFAHSLSFSSEGKLSGSLILANNQNQSVSETAYTAFLDELGKQRVELVRTTELQAHCLAAYQFLEPLRNKFGSNAVPALREFLTKSNRIDMRTLQVLWIPAGFPPDDAGAIWKEFRDYKARVVASDLITSQQQEAVFGAFETAFVTAFPSFAETPQHPLSVTKFWQPGINEGTGRFVYINACEANADTVALRGFYPGQYPEAKIYFLNFPDFKSESAELPQGVTSYGYCFSPDALYVTGFKGNPSEGKAQIYRFDRAARSWEAHDSQPSYDRPILAHDQLFLYLNSSNGQDSAIAKYDWASQNLALLSAARRRPAQNQFDDRQGYLGCQLFASVGGTLGVNIAFQCYTARETTGAWPEIIPGFPAQLALSVGGEKTVLPNWQQNIAVLIDPAKAKPELLLAPPDVPLSPSLASLGPPRLHLSPADFHQAFAAQGSLGMHGDAFFALIRHQTVPAYIELFWLHATHGVPVHIPLQFDMDPATQASLKKLIGLPSKPEGMIHPETAGPGNPFQLVAVDAGICLYSGAGVWFLPYEDIEAYLKSVQK